jgi:dynein heavy chain
MDIKFGEFDVGEKEDEVKKLRNGLQAIKVTDRKSNVFLGITDLVKRWSIFVPLILDLKDKSMDAEDDRHWAKIRKETNSGIRVQPGTLMKELWGLKLFDLKDKIEDITEMAKNEAKMEKGIIKVKEFWEKAFFELVKHKDTDIKTLKMLEEQFETLEEHQLSINSMLTSKFVAYFEKTVEKWKQDLGAVYEVTQSLSEVQKNWSFLENLFIHSEEVKKELPVESKNFIDIDKNTKDIMKAG